MSETIDLSIWQMLATGVYVIATLIMIRVLGIPREREILTAVFRMTVQLIIAGYVLVYVFDHPHFWMILIILAIMLIFAVSNAIGRIAESVPAELRRVMAVALIIGTVSALAYFLFVVIQGDSWRNPRYFIPISGMLIGNAMTGVSLGASRMIEGMHDQRPEIETALMLGATPKVASRTVVRRAFDAALLPTVNSMVGIGIVSLPGMMTGQILAGQSPLVAIQYQIGIMIGIMGATAFSVLILVEWGYRAFFTPAAQLVDRHPET